MKRSGSMLDTELPALRQALSNAQATQIAGHLKGRLLDAAKPLQRRYLRGRVSEIIVGREKASYPARKMRWQQRSVPELPRRSSH
jgi:hypothetical protein